MSTIEHSSIARITASMHQPLFCPLLGVFPIPYLDPVSHTQWSYAFGIPITPHVAIVFLSKTVKLETINSVPLWSYSVGLPPKTKSVVIAPHVARDVPHEKIIETIHYARSCNLELFKLTAETAKLIAEMAGYFGYSIEKVFGSMHGNTVSKIPKRKD